LVVILAQQYRFGKWLVCKRITVNMLGRALDLHAALSL
jgi:hypothetical protein